MSNQVEIKRQFADELAQEVEDAVEAGNMSGLYRKTKKLAGKL